MFNKLKSIKKKNDIITTYQVERLPDFFDNVERLIQAFKPLICSLNPIENKEALTEVIIIFKKCADFCVETEKIKTKSYYGQNNYVNIGFKFYDSC